MLRISRHFCGWFEKHSMGKHKENLRTVYNLFDHWNMALSSDFRHLKTLLATRLVFHLFWRWQPVAHALFQQPRNAAVLKHSQPRTNRHCYLGLSNSCWTILMSLLSSLRSLPFSLTLCCPTAWNNCVDLPRGPSVVAYICITAWIFVSLNCWCIKGLYCCTSMTRSKLSLLQDLFGDNILTWQHFFFIEKHVMLFFLKIMWFCVPWWFC